MNELQAKLKIKMNFGMGKIIERSLEVILSLDENLNNVDPCREVRPITRLQPGYSIERFCHAQYPTPIPNASL